MATATTADPAPPGAPRTRGSYERRWWTLGVLCLSLVVIGVDNTILNVALPTLVQELNASNSQLQWIVDGYVLVFAGLLLTAGSLGDRFGRRGALSIGLVIFGLGSALSARAGSSGQLIATRAVMGVGGALIMPATLSIVINVFTDAKERARAIAIWAGFSAAGIALGPVAGGFLLQHFYWGSVFLVNVPIVIVALIGGRLFVPTSKDPSAPKLDPMGAVLSIVGLTALLYALIEAPSTGWTEPPILTAIGVAVVVLAGFVLWERWYSSPMLDVRFFRNPRFTAASTAITLTFFALFGSLFLLTQYRQFVLGLSALEAGYRVLPFAITTMIVAPQSARFVGRVGTKVSVALGLTITALGLFIVTRAGVDSDLLVIGATIVMAVGMGLTMAPATESIMGSLPREKAGVGSAVNDTTRQIGGALGVAVIGSIFSSVYSSRLGDVLAGAPAQLPPDVAAQAEDSVGYALGVAQRIGGPAGDALASAARTAYVEGMHSAVIVGAAAALLGAVVALLFLPARAKDDELGDDLDDAPVIRAEETLIGVGAGELVVEETAAQP